MIRRGLIIGLLAVACVAGGLWFLATNPRPVSIEEVEADSSGNVALIGGVCGADLEVTRSERSGADLLVEVKSKPTRSSEDCIALIRIQVTQDVTAVVDLTSGNRFQLDRR